MGVRRVTKSDERVLGWIIDVIGGARALPCLRAGTGLERVGGICTKPNVFVPPRRRPS